MVKVSTVGVINYGLGNISSIRSAFRSLGVTSYLVSNQSDAMNCSHFILPGVGAMKSAMEEIVRQDIDNLINFLVEAEKPILGICLGMQLLGTKGYELSETLGLNLIEGEVHLITDNPRIRKLPRFGWIDVSSGNLNQKSRLLVKNETNRYYFANSYHLEPMDSNVITGLDMHGLVAVVEKDLVFGTQFHPEKSGIEGLKLLQRFLDIRGNN